MASAMVTFCVRNVSDGDRALGQLTLGRHGMHRVGQVLAELRQKVIRLHAGLARHALYLIVTHDVLKLLWRDRLVGAIADPGLGNMPKAGLLKARYDAAEATTHALPHALALILAHTAAQQAGQHTRHGRCAATGAAHQVADDCIEKSHDEDSF
jgi:hypothetical protein